MGYTHYWERNVSVENKEQYGKLALDAKKIVEFAKAKGIKIADWEGQILDGNEWTESRFDLNGYRDESHETFIWQAQVAEPSFMPNEGYSFDFCKTARKPYDCVVTAILCRAKYHYGDSIKISSDGYWADWKSGRDLYEEVFGESAECPFDEVSV